MLWRITTDLCKNWVKRVPSVCIFFRKYSVSWFIFWASLDLYVCDWGNEGYKMPWGLSWTLLRSLTKVEERLLTGIAIFRVAGLGCLNYNNGIRSFPRRFSPLKGAELQRVLKKYTHFGLKQVPITVQGQIWCLKFSRSRPISHFPLVVELETARTDLTILKSMKAICWDVVLS